MGNALHEAIRGGHGDMVSDLLENGASVSVEDKEWCGTPLHVVAMNEESIGDGTYACCCKRGPTTTPRRDDQYGNHTAIFFLTTHCSNLASAQALTAAGADVNLWGTKPQQSVVHVAAQRGLVDIISAAIERGADLDAVDESQWTPLSCNPVQSPSSRHSIGASNVPMSSPQHQAEQTARKSAHKRMPPNLYSKRSERRPLQSS